MRGFIDWKFGFSPEADASSKSSSAFASFRSAVPKPSMNQP
jgi:hypothetical protein